MVEGEGFEPSKPVATDLQSVPFDRSGTPPLNFIQARPSAESSPRFSVRQCAYLLRFGAGDGTRTRNLLITNQLLYH